MAVEKGEVFTCKVCGYTGPSSWTRAEAEAEAEIWESLDPGGARDIVCDPCFEAFMAWFGKENQA